MPIPDFVTRLRSGVGHDLLWLPGVSAVVTDDDGRLLLGRRADNGRWAVVSGILDPGEEPAPAALREVLEETGIVAEVIALTAVSTSEPVTYPNGDRAQYLDLCFWCRRIGGEAHVADDESLEVGWFAPDALPEPLNPSSVERIARTLAHIADSSGTPPPWFAR
jgi:8-oxo-dGTP pyrophosphatase MutT (NUDIX family)